jgi:hypothetical protein
VDFLDLRRRRQNLVQINHLNPDFPDGRVWH